MDHQLMVMLDGTLLVQFNDVLQLLQIKLMQVNTGTDETQANQLLVLAAANYITEPKHSTQF
jgi:vesicle coat complex subunit